jgi:dUTP pyrophosphatase
MIVKFKRLSQGAVIPSYMTAGAVGMDVHALGDYIVVGDTVVRVRTGIAVAIPEGYEINVRARSGLSIKYPNYFVISGGGTIDSDYRGEIIIPVINRTRERWEIKEGDRIAQLVVSPVAKPKIELVYELLDTERGSGGFGHTGD